MTMEMLDLNLIIRMEYFMEITFITMMELSAPEAKIENGKVIGRMNMYPSFRGQLIFFSFYFCYILSFLYAIICPIYFLPHYINFHFSSYANQDKADLNSLKNVFTKNTNIRFKVYIFKDNWSTTDKGLNSFLFWVVGTQEHITQFVAFAKYYAEQGFVCFIPDYRVRSTDNTKVVDSVEDAQDAFAFVRSLANEFGIDSNRIASAGGSAGGHLAAVLGTVKDNRNGSLSKPNAMILFNPVLVIDPLNSEKWYAKKNFIGADPYTLSPFHQIDKSVPPVIIYHGTSDDIVPFKASKAFHESMLHHGLDSSLKEFEGRGHGFFNRGKHLPDSDYKITLNYTDDFLEDIGWLPIVDF